MMSSPARIDPLPAPSAMVMSPQKSDQNRRCWGSEDDQFTQSQNFGS
jgi:hypothetical protein